MMGRVKSLALLALGMVLVALPLVTAPEAEAASISTSPVQYNLADNFLAFSFTNDDNLVVYNTASTDLISHLAQEIYDLGNSAEASAQDMVTDEWGISIQSTAPGEVYNGWSAAVDASAGINLTNNGIIPDGTYDVWRDTNTNSIRDTMALRVTIPNSLLERNGTPGYQWDGDANNPNNDYAIKLSEVPHPDMFVGELNAFNQYSASSSRYELIQIVPEPGSAALLGLGGGLALLRRNRKR